MAGVDRSGAKRSGLPTGYIVLWSALANPKRMTLHEWSGPGTCRCGLRWYFSGTPEPGEKRAVQVHWRHAETNSDLCKGCFPEET